MLLPQEVAAKAAIPSLRALVAKKLIEKHGFTQRKASLLMSITQAAVSNYIRQTRGATYDLEKIPEVHQICEEIADMVASGAKQEEVLGRLTQAVQFILANRLMCDIHVKMEPTIDVDSCHLCNGYLGEITFSPKKQSTN